MGKARPIAGGVLLIVGLALVANRWGSSRIEGAGATTVAELRAAKGRPRAVTVPGATFDWQARRYRTLRSPRLYTGDPRQVVSVADVRDLLARSTELNGRMVRLESAPEPAMSIRAPKQASKLATTLCAPVDAAGKAWVASEPFTSQDDPRAKAFLARTSHVGVVVPLFEIYDVASFEGAYERAGGHAIPATAVAIETEKPPPVDAAIETLVPLAGSNGEVFAVLDGTPAAPPAAIAGVAERERPGRLLVWVGDAEAFRARHPDFQRVSVVGLVLIAAALGLLLAHALLRRMT